jgi:hypothetical protein
MKKIEAAKIEAAEVALQAAKVAVDAMLAYGINSPEANQACEGDELSYALALGCGLAEFKAAQAARQT